MIEKSCTIAILGRCYRYACAVMRVSCIFDLNKCVQGNFALGRNNFVQCIVINYEYIVKLEPLSCQVRTNRTKRCISNTLINYAPLRMNGILSDFTDSSLSEQTNRTDFFLLVIIQEHQPSRSLLLKIVFCDYVVLPQANPGQISCGHVLMVGQYWMAPGKVSVQTININSHIRAYARARAPACQIFSNSSGIINLEQKRFHCKNYADVLNFALSFCSKFYELFHRPIPMFENGVRAFSQRKKAIATHIELRWNGFYCINR